MSPDVEFPPVLVCALTGHRPRFQWRATEYGMAWGAWCERCGACSVYAPLASPRTPQGEA